MPIPMREIRSMSREQLIDKYGEEELKASSELLKSLGSSQRYIAQVDSDPGKMDFFSEEYAKNATSNLMEKAGNAGEDILNMPKGVWNLLHTPPIEAASGILSGVNERYGVTDILSKGDFTKFKRTLANDPFGVALDIPTRGGILGKLGRKAAGVGKAAADVLPHGAAAMSGVDIGALRKTSEMFGKNAPKDLSTFENMVNQKGSLEASLLPEAALDKLQAKASGIREAEYKAGGWDAIPITHAEIKTHVFDKKDSIIQEAYKTDGPSLMAERASKGILRQVDEILGRLAKEPNPTVEIIRQYRKALDTTYDTVTKKYQYKTTGHIVKQVRAALDELAASKSADLKASDFAYTEKMRLHEAFEVLTSAETADKVIEKLTQMVNEKNPEALSVLKQMEKETGLPLSAAATGSAMSTTAPSGLAGQSAYMRAARTLLPSLLGGSAGYSAGGLPGAGVGALVGALASTRLASPQALGKTMIKAHKAYIKPRLGVGSAKDAVQAVKPLASSPITQTLLRTLMYGGLQNSRNRANR